MVFAYANDIECVFCDFVLVVDLKSGSECNIADIVLSSIDVSDDFGSGNLICWNGKVFN